MTRVLRRFRDSDFPELSTEHCIDQQVEQSISGSSIWPSQKKWCLWAIWSRELYQLERHHVCFHGYQWFQAPTTPAATCSDTCHFEWPKSPPSWWQHDQHVPKSSQSRGILLEHPLKKTSQTSPTGDGRLLWQDHWSFFGFLNGTIPQNIDNIPTSDASTSAEGLRLEPFDGCLWK